MIPRIMQTQDDNETIITLQWRNDKGGAAIVFSAGTDTANFSWSDGYAKYTDVGMEFSLSKGLPSEAVGIMKSLGLE